MPEPLIFQGNLAFLFSLTVKDGIITREFKKFNGTARNIMTIILNIF